MALTPHAFCPHCGGSRIVSNSPGSYFCRACLLRFDDDCLCTFSAVHVGERCIWKGVDITAVCGSYLRWLEKEGYVEVDND